MCARAAAAGGGGGGGPKCACARPCTAVPDVEKQKEVLRDELRSLQARDSTRTEQMVRLTEQLANAVAAREDALAIVAAATSQALNAAPGHHDGTQSSERGQAALTAYAPELAAAVAAAKAQATEATLRAEAAEARVEAAEVRAAEAEAARDAAVVAAAAAAAAMAAVAAELFGRVMRAYMDQASRVRPAATARAARDDGQRLRRQLGFALLLYGNTTMLGGCLKLRILGPAASLCA